MEMYRVTAYRDLLLYGLLNHEFYAGSVCHYNIIHAGVELLYTALP
jgi:hypothetical protein